MAQAIDPVCGMTVETEGAQLTSEYESTTYYFCGAGCKRAFDKNPTEFVPQQSAQVGGAEQDGTGGHGA